MTPDQFTAAIEPTQAARALTSWPIVDMSGTADDFRAYDADRMILLRGLYVTAITQDAIERAIVLAEGTPPDEMTALIGLPVACVIVPNEAFYEVSDDDYLNWESLLDCVIMYAAALTDDGLLSFDGDVYGE